MAVFALVVIGALVAGTFFAGRLEQRTGLNSMFAEQSFELAEAGAIDILANWTPATFNGLPPGTDTTLGPVTLAPLQVYVPTITRLTPNLFFVRANGQRLDADGSILAERTVGLLARLGLLDLVEEKAGPQRRGRKSPRVPYAAVSVEIFLV
jgi:hypothetical protein